MVLPTFKRGVFMQIEKIQYSAPKIPELVMNSILSAIESGKIKLNEELMAERELAVALGVGRGSLRESLAILEFLGVIEARGNRKVVVKNTAYIRRAISFLHLSDQTDTLLSDFLCFRMVNEVAIARLACDHANNEDIQAMADAVEQLEKNPADHNADVEFHSALARASHNAMFAAAIDLINSMIMELRIRFMAVSDYHKKTVESHRLIYLAVRDHDKERAAQEMQRHLENIAAFAAENPIDN